MPPPSSKPNSTNMDRIIERGRMFICTVCPGKGGQPHTPMTQYQVNNHIKGPQHQKRLQHAEIRDLDTGQAGAFMEPDLQSQESTNPSEPTLATLPTPATEPYIPPPPILLPSGDWSFTPPAPVYDFFQDSAYETVGLEEEGCVFPALDQFGFPLQTSSAPSRASVSSSSKPNPYDDTSQWRPYPSKEVFLTYNLFHAPAIQFSEAQQSAILDWAAEMGAEKVPSMYDLEQCGQKIKNLMGDPSRVFKTDSGHIFYVNKLETMLTQDFANPSVRQHLEFYPNECDGHVSEIWHGEKMTLGENREQLTPMASYGGRSFFVNEISLLDDGSFFLVDMFLKRHGQLHARGRKLEAHNEIGRMGLRGFCLSGTPVDYPLSHLRLNCVELKDSNPDGLIVQSGDTEWHENFLPHPLRAKADGREVYSVPYIVFVDDVSGNTSKAWNKHWCCYVTDASLPREKFNERQNIRFMSTSQHASPIEMLGGICQVFDEAFDEPIVVWDMLTGREVLVRPYIHFISGDNPMHAEECSSSGLRSNYFCRTCCVGGTQVFKASEEGYSLQMESAALRRPQDTIDRIKYQYEIAFTSKSVERLREEQRNSGVKDAIAQPYLESIVQRRQELQKTTTLSLPEITLKLRNEFSAIGSKLRMNPLLSHRWLNVHLDTPTEILHTILLGAAKYLWIESVRQMDKNHAFALFGSRLRSLSVSGLNNGPISGYITRNRGSLNGKHFKTLLQTAPFCLHNLVQTDLIHAWITLGRLTVLAWSASIDNIEHYTRELQITTTDFLYSIAKCLPSLLVQKTKTHLLIHMPMFVRRFGPLQGPNSERYESFNASFRAASVHSNRQAPSRDIAHTFAVFDVVKHVMLGGYWLDAETNQRVRAGTGILQLCESSNFAQRLLGIKKTSMTPGTTFTKRDSVRATWEQLAPQQVHCPDIVSSASILQRASNVLAQNGDRVATACNVAYTYGGNANITLGRIHDILTRSEQPEVFVILKPYRWMGEDDSVRMPVVSLGETFHVVTSDAIVCEINLQHRCAKAGCTDTGAEVVREERQDSGVTRPAILHNDDAEFIVNTISLHNSASIQRLVRVWSNPSALLQPQADYARIRKDAAASLARKKAPKADSSDTAASVQPAQTTRKAKASAPKALTSSVPASRGHAHTTSSAHAGPSTSKKRRFNLAIESHAEPSTSGTHAVSATTPPEQPLVIPPYVPPVLMSAQPPEQRGRSSVDGQVGIQADDATTTQQTFPTHGAPYGVLNIIDITIIILRRAKPPGTILTGFEHELHVVRSVTPHSDRVYMRSQLLRIPSTFPPTSLVLLPLVPTCLPVASLLLFSITCLIYSTMPRLAALLDEAMNQPAFVNPEDPIEPDANADGGVAHGGNGGAPEPDPDVVRLALEFAEASMDHHGLEGPVRDDVRRFAQLDEHHRSIELYILMEALKRHSGTSTAAYDFARSQTFMTHVVNRLKMIVMAPHTMYYITPLQEWALIPPEILHNNDQWEIFAAAVRVRLTTLRSQIRGELKKGSEKKLDINQLLYKIAPKQAIISDSHRARWAWVALSLDDFKQACAEGDKYDKGNFWDYLEDQLAATKKAIAGNRQFTTDAARSAKFAEVFTRALAEHRRLFPTRVTRGRTGERSAWQATIEESMGMGREIYASVLAADGDD
ncbi:hypothetical protein FRC12_008883 [Ceratobasidium sp. 428]|nr:hypothetical protein FRC12_008883 [Ceratobasidium sp. 428]